MENNLNNILKLASKRFDQTMVRKISEKEISASFEDSKFKKVESKISDAIMLNVIKDKVFGFAYTTTCEDPEILVNNAENSLIGKVDGSYGFAENEKLKIPDSYNDELNKITSEDILQNLNNSLDYLKSKTKAQINLEGYLETQSINIKNTNNIDYEQMLSVYLTYIALIYPGSYSNVSRMFVSKDFAEVNKEDLDFLLYLYNQSEKQVKPQSGKMKVLFLPESFYTFVFRLSSALSATSLIYKRTPLDGKLGQKIASSNFTLYDDPTSTEFPLARAFDDEGTVTKKIFFIEKGVFTNFYFDRKTAFKAGSSSTGHGYMQDSKSIPSPYVPRLMVEKGNKDIYEMISMIDKGIIIPSVLGAHSGNIQNGDFSIGLSPGIYVENGKIVGHVKDAMVAANIYDCLNSIIEIENKQHFASMGIFPSILFDNLNVTIK